MWRPPWAVSWARYYSCYTALKSPVSLSVTMFTHTPTILNYIHCDVTECTTTTASLTSCIEELERWMTSNRLKLNADKTQFIWTGSVRQQVAKMNTAAIVLKGHQIIPECCVKCLGIFNDTNLTFAPHIRRVAASCFWQIRQLWKIRQSLSVENTKTLVHALVASRVDYCNSTCSLPRRSSEHPSSAVCLKRSSSTRLEAAQVRSRFDFNENS